MAYKKPSPPVGTNTRVAANVYEKKEKKQLDIDAMTAEDIQSLQKTDPFMFYSIPGVRKAAVFHQEIDYSDKGALHGGLLARRDSAPAESGAKIVRRRTAITFEAHPDALLADVELLPLLEPRKPIFLVRARLQFILSSQR